MKVEINVPKKAKEKGFPRLMIVTADVCDNGMIVLMISDGVGTVLLRGEKWNVGGFTDSWAMDHFSDFEGSVTISND